MNSLKYLICILIIFIISILSSCREQQIIIHDAKEPTCLQNGNILYYENISNGKLYFDMNLKKQIKDNSHIIPALGHDFADITYTWNDDFTECTAKACCSRSDTHILVEKTNNIESNVIPFTCTTGGKETYIAKFENPVFIDQEYSFETLAQHVYSSDCDRICNFEGCNNRRYVDVLHTNDFPFDGFCDLCETEIVVITDIKFVINENNFNKNNNLIYQKNNNPLIFTIYGFNLDSLGTKQNLSSCYFVLGNIKFSFAEYAVIKTPTEVKISIYRRQVENYLPSINGNEFKYTVDGGKTYISTGYKIAFYEYPE